MDQDIDADEVRGEESPHVGASHLFWLALIFEGALAAVAFGVGWLTARSPLERFEWTWRGAAWGVGATVPLYLVFLALYGASGKAFREIRRFLRISLGRSLAEADPMIPLAIAILAGVGEELLFRGVVEAWLGPFGSAILFGLAHAVTPLYAVVAMLMGLVFSLELYWTGNLLAPILTHALYDWLAFRSLIRDVKKYPVTPEELTQDTEHSHDATPP